MSQSKAKLAQQVEHMSRVVQEAALLLEIWDSMSDGDIEDRYFEGLRDALNGNNKGQQ
jgi:hypothetical protein